MEGGKREGRKVGEERRGEEKQIRREALHSDSHLFLLLFNLCFFFLGFRVAVFISVLEKRTKV